MTHLQALEPPYLRRGHQGSQKRSGLLTVLVFTASHRDKEAGVSCRAHSGSDSWGVGEVEALGVGEWRWLEAGAGGMGQGS